MRNITAITALPFSIPPIEDVVDTLPNHKTKVYQMRPPDQIDTIIVHHMASEAPLMNQAQYHVNGRGWPRIGYHLVVDTNRLLQTNDLLAESYHTAGWNDRAVSISVRGDLSKRTMTEIERMLVYGGIMTLKSIFNIKQILGHNEASKLANKPGTSCPCTDMDKVRSDIAALEEQMSYHALKDDNTKIYEMIKRIGDLYDKHKDPNSPFQYEATRKLTVIHDVLTERKWF